MSITTTIRGGDPYPEWGGPSAMMSDPVDKMLKREEFRGLWRSRCLEPDGSITAGWSVTFVHGSDYWDVPYQDAPEAACQYALDRLAKLG